MKFYGLKIIYFYNNEFHSTMIDFNNNLLICNQDFRMFILWFV